MNSRGIGQQVQFEHIPLDDWRTKAACFGRAPQFDDRLDGESKTATLLRQRAAKKVCKAECEVRDDCGARVDPDRDDGVRAGHVLPPLGSSRLTPRDVELRRLLRAGWPLDEAAAAASRRGRKAS